MRFGRGVLYLLLIVMLMSGSATAVKVTEHSCYTGLDPETATSMTCGKNKLTGAIPPELGDLTGLTKLWLSRNELTGTIPAADLGKLTGLTYLHMAFNLLTGP